jgi:hypothetical protein
MADRDMRPEAHEDWSDRNQTLRHSGTKTPWDDQALLHDPNDYSALGGPDDQPAYGRSRSDNGTYPFADQDGPYDRDTQPAERGGYMKLHAPHGQGRESFDQPRQPVTEAKDEQTDEVKRAKPPLRAQEFPG